jgi:AraC family ethanolamine operon transcriptional activator
MRHGFLNVGRFAYYYRQLFGEYPSDTRRGTTFGTAWQIAATVKS